MLDIDLRVLDTESRTLNVALGVLNIELRVLDAELRMLNTVLRALNQRSSAPKRISSHRCSKLRARPHWKLAQVRNIHVSTTRAFSIIIRWQLTVRS